MKKKAAAKKAAKKVVKKAAKKAANKVVKTARKVAKKGAAKGKVEKVMHEYKEGKLHSGSKAGPKVTNPKQALAIGLSEARKKGAKIPKKRK
jgi:hypothetical protein